jgi:hypothetical protein
LFYFNKNVYKGTEFGEDIKDNVSIGGTLLRLTAVSLVISVGVVVVFEVIENFLLQIHISPQIRFSNSLRWFQNSHTSLASQAESLRTLLSAIASIVGIFIGLYFTAISVVVSSMFVKVPSSLRELVLKEKVGNLYIRILSVLTVMCILLLGYQSFGGQPGVINSFVIVLLSCLSVWCFVVLGARTFFFFDPTNLSDSIFYELNGEINKATIKGFRWSDASFQAHHQKLARQNILTLETLIKLCVAETQLLQQSLSSVMKKTMYWLSRYETSRSFIPTDSKWFTLAPRYKNWFLCDSSALILALESKTSIQPEMKPNNYWVQDRVAEIFASTFTELMGKNNVETVYDVMSSVNYYFESLGNCLEMKKGISMIGEMCAPIKSYYKSNKPKYSDIEYALFDSYGLALMSLALGFHKHIRAFSVAAMIKEVDSINWSNSRDIYKKLFPPLLIPRIEFVQKGVEFEIQVEGKQISPQWHIRQLIINRYAEIIIENIDDLLKAMEDVFVTVSDELITGKSSILASHHSQRGMETCNKIRAHLPRIVKHFEDMKQYAVNKDLPLPQFDIDIAQKKLEEISDKLIQNIAQCIPALSTVEQKEDFPDLFGQSYSLVCQNCYEALREKQTDKYKILFPRLFLGAISAHEKLRTTLKGWRPEDGVMIMIEPLIDILELSGYSKIYSELYEEPEIWEICKKTWDGFFKVFESNGGSTDIIKKLVAAYELRGSLLRISPRDTLRTNWEMNLEHKLRGMGFADDMFTSYHQRRPSKHKSKFINNFFGGRIGLHVRPAEIFIVCYLLERADSKGVEFNDRWNIKETLDGSDDEGIEEEN